MILFQKYVHMIFIHSLYPTEKKKKNYRICIFLKYFYITLCEIFFIIQQWKSKTKKKKKLVKLYAKHFFTMQQWKPRIENIILQIWFDRLTTIIPIRLRKKNILKQIREQENISLC